MARGLFYPNFSYSSKTCLTLRYILVTAKWVAFAFSILMLSACEEKTTIAEGNHAPASAESPSRPNQQKESKPYLSKKDLVTIQNHGVLRLIAPSLDQDEGLPNVGLSIDEYKALAEEFARNLDLKVKWHYVKSFNQLIPALVKGEGDIIIANLTETKLRKETLAFARELTRVSEWVVSKNTLNLEKAEDLNNYRIAIPRGTAYEDTLASKSLEKNIQFLESNTPLFDVMAGIESGKHEVTVADDNLIKPIINDFPQLKMQFALKKNRKIAWAVRKDNQQLLKALNEFLVSHHVALERNEKVKRNWEEIKKSGVIRMLTLNNPASYFMWRGELMGFDYDLMHKFAKKHNLNLSVIVEDDIESLFIALQEGRGDVVAASITRTEDRMKDFLFTFRYLYVDQQIVGRQNLKITDDIDEISKLTIGVNPATSFYPALQALYPVDRHKNIVPFKFATTESLISKMVEGEFDLTVADSHLVALESTYHENIKVLKTLTEKTPIAWAVAKNQVALKDTLNAFIKKHYRGVFYNVTFDKYFKNKKKIQKYQSERVSYGKNLSPFDSIVKPLAQEAKLDWRLIVAQIYQESKFNPKARSFAGARGLMQVMPKTAKELGITNMETPENGIRAGVAYLQWLEKRFPDNLDVQERIYFSLAAYNAGVGHVRDARRLARKLGLDPNRWFNNVEVAMLKLAEPKYYKSARFGYVRGSEPVQYVREIRERYLAYLSH